MVLRCLLVVAALGVVAAPAAADNSSIEGSFDQIVDWVYEYDEVRISNCHIVLQSFGGLEARAKCYALNKGRKPMRVRVRFTALDRSGDTVVDASLSPLGSLQNGNGEELSQSIPITQKEWDSIARGRVKAAILPPN